MLSLFTASSKVHYAFAYIPKLTPVLLRHLKRLSPWALTVDPLGTNNYFLGSRHTTNAISEVKFLNFQKIKIFAPLTFKAPPRPYGP